MRTPSPFLRWFVRFFVVLGIGSTAACDKESPTTYAAPKPSPGFFSVLDVHIEGNGRVRADGAEPTAFNTSSSPYETELVLAKDASPWVHAEPGPGAAVVELTCDCACPTTTAAPQATALDARQVCLAGHASCQCTARFGGGSDDFGVTLTSTPASPLTTAGPVALHATVRGGRAPYRHAWQVIDAPQVVLPDAADVTVTVSRTARIIDDVVDATGLTTRGTLNLTLRPSTSGPLVELMSTDVPPNVTTSSRFSVNAWAYDAAQTKYVAASQVYPDLVDCAWTFQVGGAVVATKTTAACAPVVLGGPYPGAPPDVVLTAGQWTVAVVPHGAGGAAGPAAMLGFTVQ